MKKSLKKGFTLVELVIVIAVIAILSAVLIPTFGNVIQNSKETAAFQNARGAIDSFSVNNEGASIGDGWVVVFDTTVDYSNTTVYNNTTNKLPSTAYVFQLKDGQLVKEYKANASSKGEVLKGKVPADKTFTMSNLTFTADGWELAENKTSEDLTSIPLNVKIITNNESHNGTATVWWFKG